MGATTRASALAGIAASVLLPSMARAQTPASLNVAGVPEDSITPALYADQSGLFTKYGLTVHLSSERSGSAIASGVAGGSYQIAKSSIVSLILARAKGIPFVIVAPGAFYSAAKPNTAMLVAKASPIKTAAELNGKTIAVSALGDLYTLSTKAWMAKNGGDPDSIKLVELPISEVPAAVASGRIDAGMVIEPVLERAIESGTIRVIAHPMDAIAARFLYSGWFTMNDWATAHPKETSAFVTALRDASIYTNAHESQTVDLLAKFSGIAPSDIAKMVRAEGGTALDPKQIQPVIDACAKYKLIPTAFDAREMIKT
jgi:NitT/TauT family transport system substrate-binding protein